MKDVPNKSTGDKLSAEEYNEGTNEELKNIVTDTSQIFSSSDLHQLSKAVSNYTSVGDFFVDSGIADVYVLSPIGDYKAPTAFRDGMRLRFRPVNANTGASTVNPFTLGVKDIKHETGRDLLAGELVTGKETEIIYRDASGYFIISDIVINNLPKDYRSGVLLVNNSSDPLKDIDFEAGEWRSEDDTTNLTLISTMIKQIDADWAEGTNDGGFPSGLTLSTDTWYHCFLIGKIDGTTDAGFDTSITATNLLADATGYIKYKRIGSVMTDSSSDIVLFIMNYIGLSRLVYWKTPTLEYDVNNPGTAAILTTIKTPPDVNTRCIFNAFSRSLTIASNIYFSFPGQTDDAPDENAAPLAQFITGAAQSASAQIEVLTNTSSQIRQRSRGSDANTNIKISTLGYIE